MLDSQGLIDDLDSDFWEWQVGERKEPGSKNRKDRRKRRWWHEEEIMRHVLPVHLCRILKV